MEILKWYGYTTRMEDNIWPKGIMTCSPGGARPEVKWEKDVETVMKQRNLTYGKAINWKLW